MTWQFVFVHDMKEVKKAQCPLFVRSVMFSFLAFLREYTENWHVLQLLRGQSWQSFFIIVKRNDESDLYTYLLWAQAPKNNNITKVLLFEGNWSCSHVSQTHAHWVAQTFYIQSFSCSFTRHSVENETFQNFYKPIICSWLSAFRISLRWSVHNPVDKTQLYFQWFV